MRFIPAGAGNTKLDITECSRVAVYPRWRGEHAPCNLCAADSAGLSPLARGTPIIPAGIERLSRFIPAGAGNTTGKNPPTATGAVYPRWRGEHAARYRQPRINPRFIPAGAGNTSRLAATRLLAPVYPRWRGEHGFQLQAHREQIGLSPLARGTLNIYEVLSALGRFIPAGAGNTTLSRSKLRWVLVYPRWRGEHTKHT